MDSVSRPLLIALAGIVALAAIWLVALKPKPVAVQDTPLAPTTAIPKAKQAAAASDAASARLKAAEAAVDAKKPAASVAAASGPTTPAASASASKAAAPAAAKSTAAKSETSRADAAIARDLKRGKVVVLLFWNSRSADDVATRGTVRELDRRGGKVAVHVARIENVGRYESITEGVTVAQSPTILVIDRRRQVRAIVGLTESRELSQAVSDALAGR